MDLKREVTARKTPIKTKFDQPLILLRDTEALLRDKTVGTLVPVLPPQAATRLQQTSEMAKVYLNQLAEIELDQISDFELQPSRILVGLSFVGFGSLAIVFLMLYLYTLHPELSTVEQIGQYWYHYAWCVSLGVAGMFILGREAMRQPVRDRLDTE